MGLWVFLLICGPVAALLYFPLTSREQSLLHAPARASRTPAGPTPPAGKGLNSVVWIREAEDHFRTFKGAA